MTRHRLSQIGILMLDSRFPRFIGDIGHPETFEPAALVKIVRNATPRRVVTEQASGLVEDFIDAATELEQEGVDLITTSCGFLVLHQAKLQASVNVPLVSSSLLAVPIAIEVLRKRGLQPAILTISADNLTNAHLQAANCPSDIPVGAPDPKGHFCTQILSNNASMDNNLAREEIIATTTELMRSHNNIGALVLECTNMPPYASDLERLFKIPILSLPSLLPFLQIGLSFEAATRKALAA